MLRGQVLPHRSQVPLDDTRYVLRTNAGVPDVVWVDEDDRPLMVAAGAGVAHYDGGREPEPLDLSPELLQEFDSALRAAAPVSGRGAHEDLTQLRHGFILRCAGDKSS